MDFASKVAKYIDIKSFYEAAEMRSQFEDSDENVSLKSVVKHVLKEDLCDCERVSLWE